MGMLKGAPCMHSAGSILRKRVPLEFLAMDPLPYRMLKAIPSQFGGVLVATLPSSKGSSSRATSNNPKGNPAAMLPSRGWFLKQKGAMCAFGS
jgi:hypothetical protein